jgi:predicted MPP superfamily phosphohydrolase
MPIQLREETLDFYRGREALTILHISDIHLWFSVGILKKLKTIIFQNNPELLVFTGDYFDTPRGAYLFRDFLCEVSLSYKLVFISGNHDFVYGSQIADLFVNIPNCYCVETSVYNFISRKGYSYNITSWDQRCRLNKQTTGRNIVLIHNPEKLRENEMEGIDLILAGHLHGGQFVLFKTAKKGHFPGSLVYRYCTDKKQMKDTTLLVSKGLGDTFPFRLNCAKEVIKIKII